MKLHFVRLLADAREDLLAGYPSSLEEMRSIRERRGERIAAVDAESARPLGWIGLFPGRDEGGHFFHLAGIEILPGHKGEDVDVALMEEAIRYARERKTERLKFGTSPLLTANASLYVTRFGSRYRWRAARAADGAPWPYVTGECDIEDPLARPLDLGDDEVLSRSVVDWEGRKPVPRAKVVYSGPLSVALPELDGEALAEAGRGDPSFLTTLYSIFHALFIHGYGFAWFDRLPARLTSRGGPPFYYVMNRVLGL